AFGAGLAFVRRTRRPASQALFDVVLDLASWPGVLVVLVAAWPVDGSERSLLDPVVLQLTGLLLVPMATRLLVGPARGSTRVARLAAVGCVVTMAALAIHLATGLVVPVGDARWPGLGQLAAAGFDRFEASPWPLLVSAGAAVAAMTALAWSAGALTRVGRTRPRPLADVEDGWSTEHPGGVLLTEAGSSTDADSIGVGDGGPVPVSVTLESWPTTIDLDAEPEPVVGEDNAVDPPTEPLEEPLAFDDPMDPDELGDPVGLEDPIDLDTPLDLDGWDDRDQGQDHDQDGDRDGDEHRSLEDDPSIEDEASQTIELRPADLRRARVERGPES
ncbi:MAG: hypothetical protein AAFO29_11430, partial [Actinomycetota bacterium]